MRGGRRCPSRLGTLLYTATANSAVHFGVIPSPFYERQAELRRTCPDGIDVFYDMVGGATLDTVVPLLNVGARVVVVGTAGTVAWDPVPRGARLERDLLVKRASLHGFLVFDWAKEFPEALEVLTAMIEAGTLTYKEEMRRGLQEAPQALEDIYAGANMGKMLIQV